MLLPRKEKAMDLETLFRSYEARLDFVERAAIQAAPVTTRPLPGQPETFFSLKLQEMRWKAHGLARYNISVLRQRGLDPEDYGRFGGCLKLAEFELRYRIIRSWPGFVLLLHKLYGPFILPWAAPLFLGAVALPNMPAAEFDVGEVLAFARQLTEDGACADGTVLELRHGLQDSDLRSRRVEIWG
jgi:hypothetical protein